MLFSSEKREQFYNNLRDETYMVKKIANCSDVP